MTYDLNDPRDYLAALNYLNRLKDQGAKAELKKVVRQRTNKQNSYLYLILNYFASQYGCTRTEAKEVFFKRIVNRELFKSVRTNRFGKEVVTYRSTADLTASEMISAINNFREWCLIETDGLLQLPDPDDYQAIRHCEQEIENNAPYI